MWRLSLGVKCDFTTYFINCGAKFQVLEIIFINIEYIYIYYCNRCSKGNYIGEKGTEFCLRFNKHKMSIRNNTIAAYFNKQDHSIDNVRCIPRLSVKKIAENQMHFKNKFHILGLNRNLGMLSEYNIYKKPNIYIYINLLYMHRHSH